MLKKKIHLITSVSLVLFCDSMQSEKSSVNWWGKQKSKLTVYKLFNDYRYYKHENLSQLNIQWIHQIINMKKHC